MKRLLRKLFAGRVALLFLLGAGLLSSIFVWIALPKDVFPPAVFPRIEVTCDWGFSSLESTDVLVTRPLENVFKTVAGVTSVVSTTDRGAATLEVYFGWNTNMTQAYQDLQASINQIRAALPPGAVPLAVLMSPSAYPTTEYGFWSDSLSPVALRSVLRWEVIPQLVGIAGVRTVTLLGGDTPEEWVRLDPQKLDEYGLDTLAVEAALRNANQESFIGNISQGNQTFFGLSGKEFTNHLDIGGVVVATRMGKPLFLRDIADVTLAQAPHRRLIRVDGHPGAVIDITKQEGSDSLSLSRAVDQRLQAASEPLGLHRTGWDLSAFVQNSLTGILTDIGLAVVIILGIVLFILVRWRYAVPVILGLPMVILLELLLLKVLGQTINIMTLGGISAAIGVVADNAIVLTENFVRFRTLPTKHPLLASVAEIFPLMLAATLTTVAVFVPLALTTGLTGIFFRPLAITLASTILLSLLFSLVYTPTFLSWFIRDTVPVIQHERRVFEVLKRWYSRFLKVSLGHPLAIVLVAAVVVGGALFVAGRLPSGFLPEWDEGMVVIDLFGPSGASLAEMDKLTAPLDQLLRQDPSVAMTVRKLGTGMGTPFTAPNLDEVVVQLKAGRQESTFAFLERLRREATHVMPGVECDFHQVLADRLNDLAGTGKPITVKVFGNSWQEVWTAARKVEGAVKNVQGLNSVKINAPPQEKEVRVDVRQDRAALLGLQVNDIAAYSVVAGWGAVVTAFPRGLETIPVRVIYQRQYSLSQLRNLPVYTPEGGFLPLSRLAEVHEVSAITEVQHENGSLVMPVTAEIGNRPLSEVVKDLQTQLATLKLEGASTQLSGTYANQQASFRQLVEVLGLSILLILGILLFLFESYRTALAVFLGTVASGATVIYGLALTGTALDVSSFAGLITVLGLVVNNGILVVKYIERFHRELALPEAIFAAGAQRFRPVLITNLAAIAGFFPMALNWGKGGEVLQPFSVAMVSGLTASMLFSLVVMPVLYYLLHQRGERTRPSSKKSLTTSS